MRVRQTIIRLTTAWFLLLYIFTGVMIMYIPSTAYACSCARPASVNEELSRSQAVFSGKVLNVNENRTLHGNITKSVIFEVSQTWKGVKDSQIKIATGQGDGDCGIDFNKGDEFLIYARYSDMYGKKQLSTHMCDRSTEIESAKEDIALLGPGKPPTNEVNLSRQDRHRIIWVSGWIILAGFIAFPIWKRLKK